MMDDRVKKDAFLNNYFIFQSYSKMGLKGDEKNPDSEEYMFWLLEVMDIANCLYDVVKANGKSMLLEPERYGLTREGLEKKLEKTDEIMMDLCAEREGYYPSPIN